MDLKIASAKALRRSHVLTPDWRIALCSAQVRVPRPIWGIGIPTPAQDPGRQARRTGSPRAKLRVALTRPPGDDCRQSDNARRGDAIRRAAVAPGG